MNLVEMRTELVIMHCTESVAKLDELDLAIQEDSCNVCTHGEDYGCKDCKIAEIRGTSPF